MSKRSRTPVDPPAGFFWYVTECNIARYEEPKLRFRIALYPAEAHDVASNGTYLTPDMRAYTPPEPIDTEYAHGTWELRAASKRVLRKRKQAAQWAAEKRTVLGRHPRD